MTKDKKDMLNLSTLADVIHRIHDDLSRQAGRAVNVSLSIRNWLIGCYIAEYELNGSDRATYGERILTELANRLQDVSNCNRRQLYRYLRFYRLYPQIVGTLSPQFSPQLKKFLPPGVEPSKVATASPQFAYSGQVLLERLSYSHFDLLVDFDDETKRAFYEIESIRGNWSVRELKRQIGSLYYERSGLSLDKKKLSELANQAAEHNGLNLTVRDPYVFEFVGLKPREVMGESHLEDMLIDKLEDFLLELGNGFCFEARQKRILIGDEHFFVDLVFYHRILKCHVLVELLCFTKHNSSSVASRVMWCNNVVALTNDGNSIVSAIFVGT